MSNFTRAIRQQIIKEFAVRHNGVFNPALFLEEVETAGESHLAYRWFEWDAEKAAREHRLWQARSFAQGLRISFTVEEVGRNKAISIRAVEMPFVLSPGAGRAHGGGYVLGDVNDADYMTELCRQAAVDLRRWVDRYQSVIARLGLDQRAMERQLAKLDAAAELKQESAA